MWAIECLHQIKPVSKGEIRHCCPDAVQTAARYSVTPSSCRSCSAWPGAQSWKCPSPVEGGLLPTGSTCLPAEDPQPQHFGELEAVQCSAPGVLAAMACADSVLSAQMSAKEPELHLSFPICIFSQLRVRIWLWPQLERSSSQQGWGCLLATDCDPAAFLHDFVLKVFLFLTWSKFPAPHFATQHTAGRLGSVQYFETSPYRTNWIGIGWWTEKLLGTDTPKQCDCTSFISLEKQANSAGVCQ